MNEKSGRPEVPRRLFQIWLVPALGLMLVALMCAGISLAANPRRPAWKSDEVTVAAAWAMKEVLWVDARAEKDFVVEHVPGAISLNEDAWDERLPMLLDIWGPGKTVIVYCSSLSCHTSREVAVRLRDEVGLSPVFVLQGGWEAWEQQGGVR